ncbi:cytochrome c [Noviherbaspirillum sp. UKPF54]|uniref:c-type cytochrome n=1 Tax=Noviherbaspirillum sp. UKPF54 TaxID=2601898 RepID=UPI0011B160DD|nr:cytochrome c [Noviherbaspirillum sp. UKPF54]QDZ28562.1 cytochrome c [Noviherbaspirillum sp. UKPF54]
MKKTFALLALAGIASFAAAADVAGNADAAKNKVAMCIGCHGIPGYKATFPEVYQVPMIGGQSAKYIESALNQYKKGDRKNPSMRGIAAGLSDQDIADVAAYYAQQK